MRVPPISQKKRIKTLLGGAAIGFVVSWLLFIYIYGALQEKQAAAIILQRNELRDLKTQLAVWQEEFKDINKKNQQLLTVQKIEVDVINYEKYGIDDSQTIFEAQEIIKKDLSILLAKDLETVFSHKELIRTSIENKTLHINKKSYSLHVKEWLFYTTIQIQIELEMERK